MDDENYQKELFEFEKPKKAFPGFGRIFSKADFKGNFALTLTLEKIVFIAIGIIMFMVVIYALGVEAGKAVTKNRMGPYQSERPQQQKPQAPQSARVYKTPQIAPVKADVATPAGRKGVLDGITAKSSSAQTRGANAHAIVAVTLTRRDTALQEIERLKKEGITSYVVPTGTHFQIRIGAYSSKDSAQAQRDLKRVKKIYKDAYLKQL